MSCYGATIVIVDPSVQARIQIRMTAERLGMHVIGEGETGEDAIALYERLRPDVLSVDIAVPVLDGISATREVIARDANARVMVCAPSSAVKHLPAVRAAGATRVVLKPMDSTLLAFALQASCAHVARAALREAVQQQAA